MEIALDLAMVAKGIAMGLPLATVAGRRDVMERVARGEVWYGSTYNTHPVVMAANATVAHLERERACEYGHLFALGDRRRVAHGTSPPRTPKPTARRRWTRPSRAAHNSGLNIMHGDTT
ncbi:MAG: aminotransferase class III-fold pyridoxal phosphate-dependent enzyme [Chloroflexota bacterium]